MWALWETALFAVFHGVHIVFDRAKNFNNIESRHRVPERPVERPNVQNQRDLRVDRGRDRRSSGILSGFCSRAGRAICGITRIARSSRSIAFDARTRPG